MSISVPGVSNDKVRTTFNGGGVSLTPDQQRGSGKWIATATTQGECRFTITADFGGRQQTMGTATYRIKKVPDPVAVVADSRGGKISRDILIGQGAVIPKMENFDFYLKPPPVITSFRMSVYRNGNLTELDGTGNRFTEKMVNELKKTRAGDKVYFDYIRVRMPDGPRSLPPINFVIN
jgi:hypothetical protein